MDNAEKRLEEMLADEFWRLNHLYWIETKTGELVRFRMNWAQLAFWKEFWYRDDILKSRQLGLSTYVAMLMLDYCLFRPRFKAGIIDKALPDAQEKLRKIRLAYEMLDYVPEDGATEEDEALAAIGAAIKRRCPARFKEESGCFCQRQPYPRCLVHAWRHASDAPRLRASPRCQHQAQGRL